MAATASTKQGAKSEVNGWLSEVFRAHWERRALADKARPKAAPKKVSRPKAKRRR